MPKSKRNKHIELSKTKKHGLEGKKRLYEEIRSCVDNYAQLFVFSVTDMRNSKMKSVREQWKHSRFFIGKNKVMAMALGRTAEEEYRPNLLKISQHLKGERGLLFSNKPTEEVINWFNSYSEGDFARSGNTASENVSLKEGPLPQFAHSLESYLRQLGLPTTLKKGVVYLLQDYDVCKVGDVLTPDCARILKLLGYEMAEFQLKIECVWSQDGTFLDLKSDSKENKLDKSINSAMKEEFQISDDLIHLDDEEEMVTMEVDANKKQEHDEIIVNSSAERLSSDNKDIENTQDTDDVITESTLEVQTHHSEDENSENEQSDHGTESETQESNVLVDESTKSDETIKEDATETTTLVELTKEKLKEVETTPPKYSPKMTRSRARASALKKPLTPEERAARNLRSAKKAPKKN